MVYQIPFCFFEFVEFNPIFVAYYIANNSQKIIQMQFITKKQDLIDNVLILEGYLRGKDLEKKEFTLNLIRNSKTFCVYKVNGLNHFAPSRFLAYKNNSMAEYVKMTAEDDRDTNSVVTKIIGAHFSNDTTEEKFATYLKTLDLKVAQELRMYWRVKDDRGKNLDLKL